jgi:hypothetical protein
LHHRGPPSGGSGAHGRTTFGPPPFDPLLRGSTHVDMADRPHSTFADPRFTERRESIRLIRPFLYNLRRPALPVCGDGAAAAGIPTRPRVRKDARSLFVCDAQTDTSWSKPQDTMRSKFRRVTGLCGSRELSHFAAFFIDQGTKVSIAKSCIFPTFFTEGRYGMVDDGELVGRVPDSACACH